MKSDKLLVACPRCGHAQPEPPAAISTVCKKCGQHFRVQEERAARRHSPAEPLRAPARELRHIACFQCGTELEVPAAAQSTMCKRCSAHVDLQDYRITHTVSKNFRTRGRLVIEESGVLLNTDSIAGDVVLKGKLIGKLHAESLEIHPSSEIKGSFKTKRLVLPARHHYRTAEPLLLVSAEIAGELVANVQAAQTFVLKSTARFFGDLEAGSLVVEEGAVFVGAAKIGG